MTKPVKWFTNGRGLNFVPDFWEKLPGGDRVSPSENLTYSSTNSTVAFWRFYDPVEIEKQIRTIRKLGVNNLRIWLNYYVYENFKTYPESSNPFYENLRHLVATLEENCMYCIWVMFDALLTFRAPTLGAEYDDIDYWHYYPASSLGMNDSFISTSGMPYLSAMCKIVSGSQATIGYELMNETASQGFFTSGNSVAGITYLKQFDPTPNRKFSIGWALQPPWHDVTGMIGYGQTGKEQFEIMREAGTNLITIHPYTNLNRTRSQFVDWALSAAYDLQGHSIYFTEGAYDNGSNSFRDFFSWCESSGLGFSVYQAMASNTSGQTYPGVGLLHSDSEMRLSSTCHYLTGMAVRAGYDLRRLQLPTYKTNYSDSTGDGRDDFYYPPPNHPLSQTLGVYAKANPTLYTLGGLDKDIDQSVPISILTNWSTCAVPLSAIRALHVTGSGGEAAALPHLLAEHAKQFGAFSLVAELAQFTAKYWGVSSSPVSSYFNQFNMTRSDVDTLNIFINDLVKYIPTCAGSYAGIFLPGGCIWGPGCPLGVSIPALGDCWDWTLYTAWSDAMRTYTCAVAAQMGIFSCT